MHCKRLFDVLMVVISAPLWGPIYLVIALLVRMRLGSPVLFRQNRLGRDARLFQLLKFRTMRDAFDDHGAPLPDKDRLTPFGQWLRSTSLDELPELLNVLRGEMSLVGPRPLLVHYLPHYSHEQARRHSVTPGLTGWAQVNGRNSISWEEKFHLDVWYVGHQSLVLDLRILVLTVRRVFQRSGVNAPDGATMPEFAPDRTKSEFPSDQSRDNN